MVFKIQAIVSELSNIYTILCVIFIFLQDPF